MEQEKATVTKEHMPATIGLRGIEDSETKFLPPASSPRTPRVSYDLTKSFVHARIAGTALEPERLAEIHRGLLIDGDVRIISQMEGTQEILCLSYTEQCEILAAGISDGTVRLMKVNSGEYIGTLRDTEMQQNPGPTTSIKHRPVHRSHPISQTLTATYATGHVKCWHYPTGQCLYTIREKRQTLGLSYHPQLPKFVTVGDDTNLYLYDEETKTQERVFHAGDSPDVMNGHSSRVFSACFNPKSAHEIVSGGWDSTVHFWDTRQPHSTRYISGVHMCGDGIDISKTGKEILTCSWQKKNSMQLWDYQSNRQIVSLEPDIYTSMLYCGKYINNLFVVCGGSDENLIRIVDLRSHTSAASIRNLPGGVYDLSIGPVSVKRTKKAKNSELPNLPKIALCCGKMILEIDIS
ncbi:uncharacterized protein LOC107272147 isoform X1 [Cephus cinctus]|uniref:Uncharacterized protein LOC107272147 isoform X1 n=1 Tax=Cephus cinctus TaxID=211228 RepID=A0AAJ7C8K0_CEPCN|nr:uncharacterized protein LOC107272147 isoform X1 [Cephus cinctus]